MAFVENIALMSWISYLFLTWIDISNMDYKELNCYKSKIVDICESLFLFKLELIPKS